MYPRCHDADVSGVRAAHAATRRHPIQRTIASAKYSPRSS
jgi:hypothetical protein